MTHITSPSKMKKQCRHTRRFHFLCTQWLLAFALIASSCSDETLATADPDALTLAPNERLVSISLPGLATGESVARSDANNIALAAENEIKQLHILCFVSLKQDGSEADTPDDYTLEREYTYISGGNANDMTLVPDADGYRAGIGVPKDDTHRRLFLLMANHTKPTEFTAVPLGEFDRSTATTHATAFDESTKVVTKENLTCPLPMGARATHTVITGEGEFIANPVFTQADLAKGISARLNRRVARVDISNPDITGFTVTEIRVLKMACSVPFFKDINRGVMDVIDFPSLSLHNAAYIPAAAYVYPPLPSNEKVTIELSGIFAGNPVKLNVSTHMLPNTRYIIAVRNDQSNLRLDISVAPWNDGGYIDSDDVNIAFNTEVSFTSAYPVTAPGALLSIDNTTRRITFVTGVYKETDFLTLQGATSDRNPVGIILPPDSWIVPLEGKYDEGVSRYIQTLQIVSSPHSTAKFGEYIQPSPRETTITCVVKDAATGKPKYIEYIVRQEPCDTENAPATNTLTLGALATIGSIDASKRIIHLPPVAGAQVIASNGCIYTSNDENPSITLLATYTEENYPWLQYNQIQTYGDTPVTRAQSRAADTAEEIPCSYTTTSPNLGGTPRTGYLISRTLNPDTGEISDERWTVIQDATLDNNLLADDVNITLTKKPERELRISGDTVYMNFGVPIDDITYKIYLELRDNPAAQDRLEHTFSQLEQNIATLTGSGGRVAYATTNTEWILIPHTRTDEEENIFIRVKPHLPDGKLEGEQVVTVPTPDRYGTVVVHLRDGKTRTLTIRQIASVVEI